MELHSTFLESDPPNFEPDGKVGLLATISEEGFPHLTLITAMRAPDIGHLTFGQFSEGRGKENAEARKNCGFLLMSLSRKLWRGRALWTGKSIAGPENDIYNAKPMWRYNSYFGIHTVHYLDLVGTTRPVKLPMGKILAGAIKAALLKGRYRSSSDRGAMNPWTRRFIGKMGNLKFLSYIDDDGFPRIIPALSATVTDSSIIYIPGTEFPRDLSRIPDRTTVSLFTMSLDMEDVLVRGTFRRTGAGGTISVEWVYNSMPPVAKQIYPPVRSNVKVEQFDL